MPDIAYDINGTLQSIEGYVSSQLIKVTSNSPYTISGLNKVAAIILQYSSEKVLLSRKPSNTNGTYTTLEDTCYIGLTFYANVTVDMLKNVMLNAGSTPLPWEPYTGGLPSPSPDYPQEIQSAGYQKGIEVGVTGKNLVNADDYYSAYKQADGTYKSKTVTLNDTRISLSEFVGKEITISVKLTVGANTFGVFLMYISSEQNKINGSVIRPGLTGKSILTITPVSNTDYFVISFGSGNDDVIFSELQLELGSAATSYEPYRQPQSLQIATPTGLPAIPVNADGNYTDADGQKWVCDEIDLAKGERVQWIGKTVVDGKKVKFISSSGSIYWNLPYGTSPGIINGDTSISRYFAERTFLGNNNYDFAWTTSEKMKPYFATSEELNAFCVQKNSEGNPFTIYYCIETPIRTPLSPETIAAYKQLHTYKGTTIIDNDAGAYMSVRYEKMK